MATTAKIPITGDPDADRLLEEDPLALLVGMLLDQQVPMEWAFIAPHRLKERLGGQLDANVIARMDPDEFIALFKGPPALHRFPGSMGKRVQALVQRIVDEYGGDASRIWSEAKDGEDLHQRLLALPGFGPDKTRIFIALLAKRLGVRPPGWEQAAGPFADDTPRSVADIDSAETLARVREWKQAMKKQGKTKAD
ncbi:MAG: hypothetical protein QOI95_1974 [Acidimicrobiaceae bacterium]|jgi:uncharacterized HhH-GPD family protein